MKYLMAAALLAFFASPAQGAAQDFILCDGYPEPGRKSDALDRPQLAQFPVFAGPGDIVETWTGPLKFEAGMILHCNAALADPKLLPAFRARRASLLRAKAMHAAAGKDFDTALKALDEAEAAAPVEDFWHAQSGAVSALMIRAAIHGWKGELGMAEAYAARAAQARPMANGPVELLTIMAANARRDKEKLRAGLVALSTVTPFKTRDWMKWEWSLGNAETVVALRGHLAQPQVMKLPGIGSGGSDAGIRGLALADDAEYDALAALALATLGRQGDAEDLLAERQAKLDAALVKPQPDARGNPPSRERLWDYRAFTSALPPALNAVRNARDRVAQFRQAQEGDASAVLADIRRNTLPADHASLALLRILARRLPGDAAFLVEQRVVIEAAMASAPSPLPTITKLASLLLDPESADRAPRDVQYMPTPGTAEFPVRNPVMSVLATGTRSSGAAVTDLALLRLSEAALDAGKTHLLLRRVTRFRRQNGLVGDGFSVFVEAMPLSADDAPAKEITVRLRMLNAADTVKRLGPIYNVAKGAASRP